MRIFTTLLLMCLALAGWAQTGHEIKIKIDGFTEQQLFLAYYLGDKQYIQDTVDRQADGSFVFQGDKKLDGGIYLVVLPPDNLFFQILVDDNNQHFSLNTVMGEEQTKRTKFKNSPDNATFYDYLNYLNDQRVLAEGIQKRLETAPDEAAKAPIQAELEALNDNVLAFQKKLITDNPNTLTAAIIRANLPTEFPEFTGTDEEVNTLKWRWLQQHYFDNIDLADPRMLRTPFLFQRVDYFVQKLQVQHPDTLAKAVDYVLNGMRPAEQTFRYYLIHFLNFYAASKFVGMDAVYVHIVDNYYATGQAPWTEEEQLAKIVDNANRLKPLLIGRTAPDIRMQRRDGSQLSLSEVEAPFTVLYFWRYDCGHCKTSMPVLKEFYEKYKDRGVKIFAGCAKNRDEVQGCWDYVDENGIGEWIHVVDPLGRSRFMTLYDLKTTPQIYILDKDKKIISKRLGAEQLDELMMRLLDEAAMQDK